MKSSLWIIPAMIILLGSSPISSAELKLSPVFGDHMVLQRDKPVKVWGWANRKETITVTFSGQTKTTTTAADGSWLVTLNPMPASDQGHDLIVSGEGKNDRVQKITDVLVGEVWLLGGQSNMEMPLWLRGDGMKNAPGTRLALDTDHPWLRIMSIPQRATRHPQERFSQEIRDGDDVVNGRWFVSKSRDLPISGFSALGYYIGVKLHEKLGVPVGLIDTSWGGTVAAAWVSRPALDRIPEATAMLKTRDQAAESWSEETARKQFKQEMEDWEKRSAIARQEKKNPPTKPTLKSDPAKDRNFPSGPFNAMIWPLRNLTLRGVFFYQGENNYFDRVDPFAKTFPAVVTSWREAFREPDLPFCLFQICGWERQDLLYWQTWMPIIQEAQYRAHLSLPNTGFVVTMDYPHGDIHPMRKQPIAERAVRWALATVYGDAKTTWGTPVFSTMKKQGNRLLLTFRNPGNEKLKLTGEPAGFVIAGKDRKFMEAKAEIIDGSTVAVWSDKVTDPQSVRYAWSQRAICKFYTESGLPVGPFRTDDWPIPPSEIRD